MTKRKTELIVGVIIGVMVLILFSQNLLTPRGPVERYPEVQVSGNIEMTGKSAYRIDFVGGRHLFSAEVNNGAYVMTLPNRVTYVVTVHWKDFSDLTSGFCYAGVLSLNVDSEYLTFNTAC